MPKENNFLLLLLGQVFYFISIFVFIPSLILKERPGIQKIDYQNSLPLDYSHSYSQSFTTDRDNINSFSILFKNPNLISKDKVLLELKDGNQQTLTQLSITGTAIGDPDWIRFKFNPLDTKKGDILYINVSSDSPGNLLYIVGDHKNKSINFKTTYKADSLKKSFESTINYQLKKLNSMNIYYFYAYTSLILLVNIYLYKYHGNKKS